MEVSATTEDIQWRLAEYNTGLFLISSGAYRKACVHSISYSSCAFQQLSIKLYHVTLVIQNMGCLTASYREGLSISMNSSCLLGEANSIHLRPFMLP